MSEFKEYKPMEIEHNVKAAVENLRKAYWSNETKKVAKHYTEAEDIIISAICHHHYTVCKETTEGDLISREALKDITYINKGNFNTVEGIREWIDNAPPVDLWQMRQEATENALKKAEVLYGSPKRKWIECRSSDHWKCDECGHPAPLESRDCEWLSNFCPNCGADMRKGGAE